MKEKSTTVDIPKQLLEQIYTEVESRVEARFRTKIDALEQRCELLERRCEQLEEEKNVWRKKYYKEQQRAEKAEGLLGLAQEEIKALKTKVEEQQHHISKLQHQLYSRKTEATSQKATQSKVEPKRARGKQSGSKGHGRKQRLELPSEERSFDFSSEESCCPSCQKPYEEFAQASSEQVHYEVKVVRLLNKRKKIRKTCQCPNVPTIKVASGPPQLFKGSLFTIEFWQMILMEKFLLQRPLNRILQSLSLYGLSVSQGTITNALKRLYENGVFVPLVEGIRMRLQSANQWQMDETGWKVFQEIEGKKGFNWWLWVALSKDCVLYTVDPSRSGDVARRILGEDPVGICTTDRLGAYAKLGELVQNSWCWAHMRRDILALKMGRPAREAIAKSWIERIDNIFHLNNQRIRAASNADFERWNEALKQAMNDFKRRVFAFAKDTRIHKDLRKVFGSIAKDWDGYYLFVDCPSVPMDNNASERALRNAVTGRKVYYGSGSQWSGELSAQLFTVYETFKLNGLDPKATMLEYLYAVAKAGGKPPPNAKAFLPWNNPSPETLAGLTSDAVQ